MPKRNLRNGFERAKINVLLIDGSAPPAVSKQAEGDMKIDLWIFFLSALLVACLPKRWYDTVILSALSAAIILWALSK